MRLHDNPNVRRALTLAALVLGLAACGGNAPTGGPAPATVTPASTARDACKTAMRALLAEALADGDTAPTTEAPGPCQGLSADVQQTIAGEVIAESLDG